MNRLHFQLSYKTLEETKFCWPKIAPTRVRLNHAQLFALMDGLDWSRLHAHDVAPPTATS
ncbi:IS66 family insertion sequence element accessory protein TnpB [Bradyrhizobium manausense]|uniref:Transposase n=1 Tax=Bradyrhizobium manausense TaxID=989370 RepID=A0A0R3DWQ9_9BRAD|nr:IS66 family insertion sequence element accessory protein TnpB [Bradyrhizobium manausense]KRQ11980.1 hypothetical protein AOQ71_17345 [Bradyrhizobium manausense]